MSVIYQITADDLLKSQAELVAAGIAAYEARRRPFLTTDEMADRYGCSRDTIYARVKARALPPQCEKGRWSRAAVDKWDADRAGL